VFLRRFSFVRAALRADRHVALDDAEMHGLNHRPLRQVLHRRLQLLDLWSTIVLGAKATLLCLLFGYPIAWICFARKSRAGRR